MEQKVITGEGGREEGGEEREREKGRLRVGGRNETGEYIGGETSWRRKWRKSVREERRARWLGRMVMGRQVGEDHTG